MTEYPLLQRIQRPADLQTLDMQALHGLAAEIRAFLTESVGHTGGHLASNLGVVELTLALHRVFNLAHDRLVLDVGHQCYVHKLVTGRRDRFASLRQLQGITGFPNPRESEYDPFVVGHASTAISSALGLATAARLQGEQREAIALIGDGAIGGGLSFEALNHAGHQKENILVILNDNEMSISETVGAFSTYLTDIRSRPATRRVRSELHSLLQKLPWIGEGLEWAQEELLDAIKRQVQESHLFADLGFSYFGPIDGHNLETLERELQQIRTISGPRLLHVMTEKGRGFDAAQSDPETYHSAVPFEIRGTSVIPRKTWGKSFGELAVESLIERAREDARIVSLTAAMPTGTGVRRFAEEFPDRFFDVGIAEAHSVTFAAALARAGMRPVVAIYSTFLQRGYDQIVHDVAVQPRLDGTDASGLPVVFLLDRAGLVGADGPTHHGVFDIAFLRHIPNLTLLAPRDGAELLLMLDYALQQPGPVAIRYPRGGAQDDVLPTQHAPIETGTAEWLRTGKALTLFAYGRMVAPALQAADLLDTDGISISVVNARFAKPLDNESIRRAMAETNALVTVEDHALAGGFGSAVSELVASEQSPCRVIRLGIPDQFIEHGTVAELDGLLGLDPLGIAQRCKKVLAER